MKEDFKMEIFNFLLKKEIWRHKWEHLPAEKARVYEKYINDRLEM